ncbi:MAG TPA: hypothetical protein VGC71_13045 [Gaiellales bacterium]|jgi:hypothetical protein
MSRWELLNEAAVRVARAPESRMSRGQALRRGAAATGAIAGLGLLDAAPALAWWGSQPRPIPGGVDETFTPVAKDPFLHFSYPAFGYEAITITDFHGVMAAGETQGAVHGSDGKAYSFDADLRFMRGTYVGMDGRSRQGAFAFI